MPAALRPVERRVILHSESICESILRMSRRPPNPIRERPPSVLHHHSEPEILSRIRSRRKLAIKRKNLVSHAMPVLVIEPLEMINVH